MSQSVIEYNWNAYIKCMDKLAKQIVDSKYVPDVIIGIARGGLIPAQILGYKLNVPKVLSYGIYSYTGDNKPSGNYGEYQVPDIIQLHNQHVLLVDDLVDKGGSFNKAINRLIINAASFRTAAPLIKTGAKFIPNFYVDIIDNKLWIKTPWD